MSDVVVNLSDLTMIINKLCGVPHITWFQYLLLTLVSLHVTVSSSHPPTPGECLPTKFRDGDDKSLHLLCYLTAINSATEKTNFSILPAERAVSVTLQCTDRSSVSNLEPHGFRSLVWLEELTIIDCNLETIPDKAFGGLTRLKKLNIKSSSAGQLSFSRGSFEGLANLQSLDISQNHVRFPERGVLCSMPNLVDLNVSRSGLVSVSQLGLTTVMSQANCLRNVKHLDLSRNKLTSIRWMDDDSAVYQGSTRGHRSDVFNFPSIERLDLSFNFISSLDEDSFVFISSDSVELDMSNNQLSHLPTEIFSFSKYRHISLANNSLTSLPNEAFSKQENLQHLDLSGNLLDSSELKPTLFAETPKLLELYLHNNRYVV